jgi:hypothetical protein
VGAGLPLPAVPGTGFLSAACTEGALVPVLPGG